MPQQINLSTPVLLIQKRYFSALAMLQTLVALFVVGGALTVYGVWSLRSAAQDLKQTTDAQAGELARLRGALATTAPEGSLKDLEQQVTVARGVLAERKRTLEELRRGLMRPEFGHAARLQLVAQSIPSSAWVTEVNADLSRFEVRGFTLEPAALNEWVAKLGKSPLLAGQSLRKVQVESVAAAAAAAQTGTGQARSEAVAAGGRPLWSFALGSSASGEVAFVAGKTP